MAEGNAEQAEKSKKIYILLTKQTDPFSRFSSIVSGSRYLHASIGFEERGTFYSFNTKRGFCIEQPAVKRKDTPCMLYSLDVTDEAYNDIEERIRVFREREKPYRFNYFGMYWAIFRMPLKIPLIYHDSYFCTMFVSELIIKSGAAKLKYKPFRYLPRHFANEPALELRFEGVWGQPPKFSEDKGNLYEVPIRYVKRYADKAQKRARITVKAARRDAFRRVQVARSNIHIAKEHVFRMPGKVAIICRKNIYTVTKVSRDAIEKWWMSL